MLWITSSISTVWYMWSRRIVAGRRTEQSLFVILLLCAHTYMQWRNVWVQMCECVIQSAATDLKCELSFWVFGWTGCVTQLRHVDVCAFTCEMNGDFTGRAPPGFMTTGPLTSLCLLTVFRHVQPLFSRVYCGLPWLTWICGQSCSCDTRQQLLEIHSNINNWLWRHFRVNWAMCESLIALYFQLQ